jgi:hypothetical protein
MGLLVAPIVITPTKALTPSHVKGLLWLDVLIRSTALVEDVTCLWNLRPYNVTAQTLEYWEYLDRTIGPSVDYSDWGELELSKPYVEMHATGAQGSFGALKPYREAVEGEGYVHPASKRLLEIWGDHLSQLAIEDHGLNRNDPPGLSVEEVMEALDRRSLCLDHRGYGGPAYLDGTAEGLPLRQGITPEGHANYLLCVLRELLPMLPEHDRVLLVHDKEIEADYVLLERILAEFGTEVSRLSIGRVPIDGKVQSSRFGGWERYMVDSMYEAAVAEFDPVEFHLAMRLYFIAVLSRDSAQPLRLEVLHKQLRRARKLLASEDEGTGAGELRSFVAGQRADDGHVDPYRLTASLFEKHRPVPRRALLDAVFTQTG